MEPWRRLDDASADEARERLRACCGSTRWVERMLVRRPFGDQSSLLAAARDEWFGLGEDDWREAFAHHPRIGDRADLARRLADTRHISERVEPGVEGAGGRDKGARGEGNPGDDELSALAEANRVYEQRFGYIFIVCASGRTAAQMLALLRARLGNNPDVEIRVAAAEQAEITTLRLRGLS